MKVYLVGGAVRDELMGLDITDRDFVVTGATPSQMLATGFSQVGKGFPVFLHPSTHEEYALARKEKKTAPGHDGFHFEFSPNTTLKDDLIRRDLTINAIAQDEKGQYIDPYGGLNDIQNKILRHVSAAFCEDPLRVLRVCRFKAKFPDFVISPSTLNLMKKMIHGSDFKTLSQHRLWQELAKTLDYSQPYLFFKTLFDLNWLPGSVFKSINPCSFEKNIPQTCKLALLISNSEGLNWLHQIFHLPNDFLFIAQQTLKQHTLILGEYHADTVLSALQDLKAFSDPKWLPVLGEVARQKGNTHLESLLTQALQQAKSINAQDFPAIKPGPKLGEIIKMARLEAIAQIL
ncbi:tRNA nucleotidyltransferase [Gammaproteobacteria bacterium]|nr:tRNA nucleotidyltransferase [Gammaproteobacteria bacterium]